MASAAVELDSLATSAPTRAPSAHRIVRLNYPVRIGAHFFSALLLLSVFIGRPPPTALWVSLAITVVTWPHLAWWLANRSTNSKQTELRNLLVDSFLLGSYGGIAGYNPWIMVGMYAAMNSSNLSVGGYRHALKGVLALLAGALAGGAATGFHFQPETPVLTTVLSATAVALYLTIFGISVHVEAGRAARVRLALQDRNREIEAQTARLEEARRQADAANLAKSAFLANMRHELRTPLNAVIGYTELLEDELLDTAVAQLALPDLARIKGAARHLLRLINDVLDLSNIDSGRVQLHVDDVDLTELMDAVATSTKSLIVANGNQLLMNVEPNLGSIRADSARLRQILFNLLSNAAKFTSDGKITFSVRRQALPDQVVFDVEDTGIGLSEAQRQNLFKPFEQVDFSTTRPFGGSGLGLALSQRLCILMNGSVTVVSQPGNGSRFTVCIPSAGNAQPITDAPAENKSQAEGATSPRKPGHAETNF